MKIVFNVDAPSPAPPSRRKITLVKQQYPDLPDDEIDFGGPIIATGEDLQMGEGDTIKIELYRDGEPFAVLDKLQSIVSIPTAISFSNETNTSRCPDGDWWGQDVLLTVTIGGVSATRWLKFHNHSQTS